MVGRMSELANFDAVLRLAQGGRTADSIDLCRKLLANDPELASAWHLLGACQLKEGYPTEAVVALRTAVQLRPCTGLYRSNLGAAELKLGNFAAAIELFQDAVRLRPERVEYKWHLVAALSKAGQLNQALHYLESEIPESTGSLQRAELLLALDRVTEARAVYNAVLKHNAQYAEAWFGIGLCHLSESEFEKAAMCLSQAKQLDPTLPLIGFKLASSLERGGEPEAAAKEIAELCESQPDDLALQVRRSLSIPAVFDSEAAIIRAHEKIQERIAASFAVPGILNLSDIHTSGCHPPFHLTHLGTDNRRLRESLAAGFSGHIPSLALNPLAASRPRVGFLVTRGHEGIFLKSMGAFFHQLDRDTVEPRLFCDLARQRLIREALKLHPEECIAIHGNVPRIANEIVATRCDTIYFWEVGTDPSNFFLAQHRLAPRQCTSFGVQETSGLTTIDDYLSSEQLDDAADQVAFTERLVRLPLIPAFVERPSGSLDLEIKTKLNLPADCHIYFCNQNPLKIHPAMDYAIAEILRLDRRGIVVLLGGLASGVQRRLQARHQKSIADIANRILWTKWLSEVDFNSLTAAADVVLDTFPMSAGTSAFTTFGLGAPLLTLRGSANRGRMTAACCDILAVPELTCKSVDDYVLRAVQIANDEPLRRHLRSLISVRRSCLFTHGPRTRMLESYFTNPYLFHSIDRRPL